MPRTVSEKLEILLWHDWQSEKSTFVIHIYVTLNQFNLIHISETNLLTFHCRNNSITPGLLYKLLFIQLSKKSSFAWCNPNTDFFVHQTLPLKFTLNSDHFYPSKHRILTLRILWFARRMCSRTPLILFGSAWPFGYIFPEFYKTNLSSNCRLSDQVQYSVMASRTSNQELSEGSDAGTNCK
jgi:hypothetical protein